MPALRILGRHPEPFEFLFCMFCENAGSQVGGCEVLKPGSGLQVLEKKQDNVKNIRSALKLNRISKLSDEDLIYELLALQ